jgi:Ras-related protein Rab-8A
MAEANKDGTSSSSSSKLMQYDYLVKLLLIGDSGVGKSSLLIKFAEDRFTNHIMGTIGMDFKVKMLTLGGKRVKLQIWDTAGQERFHTITQQYYRNASAIILVYDVTNEESFNNIRRWAAQIAAHGAEGRADRMLLGNKADRPERVIDEARGQALAAEYGIPFLETSAKEGKNVNEAFHTIADTVRIRFQNQESTTSSSATQSSVRLSSQAASSDASLEGRRCCSRGGGR